MALRFLNSGYFAGKVGIGTDGPDFKLDVDGTLGVSDLPGNVSSTSVLVRNETIGPELLLNPDFATNTIWGGSASIANGQLTKTGNGLAYQTITGLVSGATYLIEVDVASIAGTNNFYLGGTQSSALIVGKQSFYLLGGSANLLVGFNNGYSGSTGSAFNSVSLKLVTSASNQIQTRQLGSGSFGDELWAVTPTDSNNIYNLNSGYVGINNTGGAGARTKLGVTFGVTGNAANLAESVSYAAIEMYPYRNLSTYGMFVGAMASTSGYIQSANTDGTAAGAFSINPWGGNVGIRTNSPDYPLEIVSEPTNVNNVLLGLGNPILAPNTRDSWIKMFGSQNTADKTVAIGNAYGQFVVNYLGARATAPLSAGTRILVVDGPTGKVGINTNSPTGNLSMSSQIYLGVTPPSTYAANTVTTYQQSFFNSGYGVTTDGLGPYPRYFNMVATGSPDGTNGGSNIRFFTTGIVEATGAQSRMAITSRGRVGIGTDSPAANLDVFSAASFRADVATGNPLISIVNNTATSNAAGTATIKFTQANTQAGGKIVSARDGNYSSGATRSSNLQFYTSSAATDSEKMRILSSGNVGINTTLPFEKLDVGGKIYAQDRVISANVSLPNENLLPEASIKVSNLNDIYVNATKTVISPYEARYVNDNTGGTTIRATTATLVSGEVYTVSIYYKDLIGSIYMDIGDTALSGNYKSATGTASVPTSGRIYGYAIRNSNNYEFIDINLSQAGSVTLLNIKLEQGTVVTEFIATPETQAIPQTITTNNLRATGSVQMGADDTTATADKAGTMRYRTATDEAVPVTGTELITGNNGDFAGVTDGTDVTTLTMWYAYGTITSSDIESEKLELITTAANTGVRIDTPTTIGNKYQLTFTATGDLGINGIHVSSIGNASTLTSQPYVFTAIAVNTQIYFRAGDNAGGTTLYSNIQLIEVTEEDASYADMCMQTGASTYEWVNIVRNTY
jgi:hypothetical protein